MDEKEKRHSRVASPEELNRYIRVSSPLVWVMLLFVTGCLVAALVWGMFGTVDVTDADGNVTSVHPITFVTN